MPTQNEILDFSVEIEKLRRKLNYTSYMDTLHEFMQDNLDYDAETISSLLSKDLKEKIQKECLQLNLIKT